MMAIMLPTKHWAMSVALVAALGCAADPGPEPEPPPGPPEPFTVMTFNVLCSFCGGGEYDPWGTRLAYFEDLFSRHDPDLVGLQELSLASEVDQLLALRPGFAAVFYQRPDSIFSYPDATVLYRTERFELLGHGFYWLSPEPDVPSSTGFSPASQLPRLVAWTHLRDRLSRRQLYFATTHFDNNPPSQQLSAPLVLERTAAWAELPVLIVGDFNSQPSDEAYLTLTEGDGLRLTNTLDSAASWRVETNQEPVPDYQLDERIDHIFVAPEQWEVAEWVVDLVVYGADGLYPSDHRAMVARLTGPTM